MVLMWLAALRGDADVLAAEAELVETATAEHGFALYALLVPMSRGMYLLADGRVEESIAPLEEAAFGWLDRGFHIPGFTPVFDLAEAYVRAGRSDAAETLLARFSALEMASLPLERAATARCRGLLAPDDAFEALFAEALEGHEALAAPLERSRTQLCLGERLRRVGRRLECRPQLRDALDGFDRLGARSWAERARGELRASGETLRREAVAGEELTPQEFQIALQVVEGKTNREVAASLFLSPKTVEFHLGRVYRKLDVSSRRDLGQVFAESVAG
jgi:DNA-binding CsgD family transcriptional regulator